MEEKLDVLFSCLECGVKDAKASVRLRHPNESLLNWMDTVLTPVLAAAHQLLSPVCFNKCLSEIMIPIKAGTEMGIGQEKP